MPRSGIFMAMNILAISGSLRAASVNTAFLRALARLAPLGTRVTVFQGLDGLALFNPDLASDTPAAVQAYWSQVAQADALLIASPEYAHGVTGAIKNALDWLVAYEPFVNKAVAVVNTSPRAHHADEALRETLRTMNARLLGESSLQVPLLGSKLDLHTLAEADVVVQAAHDIFQSLRKALCD